MRLEWVMLADHAEIIGNKLYVMGGGWDVLGRPGQFPFHQALGVAASFEVDWNDDTNRRHNVDVEIQTEDGVSLWSMGGQFEVGRPPGIRPGQPQRFQLAANVTLQIPSAGTYVIVTRVEGEDAGRAHFNVVSVPDRPGGAT